MESAKFRVGGKDLILEVGKVARQANGSVVASCGGSKVIATVCCGNAPVEGLDYVPLSVDYHERYYAAGKIPGGFLKREARPKNKEILVSRLIDRPMRPLFHKNFGREIQVVPMTISTDQENTPDILGMIASFAAVMISDIPFNGPVAAVRVSATKDGEFVINPTFTQIDESILDIVVGGTEQGICMVEGGGKEATEELILAAIDKADLVLKEICGFLTDLQKRVGKAKMPLLPEEEPLPAEKAIRDEASSLLSKALFLEGKHKRREAISEIKNKMFERYEDQLGEEKQKVFDALLEQVERELMRDSVLESRKRCDGRSPEDIRHIACEVGYLDRSHGSALFTRGETQSLGVVTLGSVYDEQIMDDIEGDRRSSFMLHYNFPPYSVGEVGRLGTGRREIGHGHLAQRAVEGVLPSRERFPYTIRVVSEILESNGSSSQATVCSSSLALLDAGVPITKPVAGIAMGLVKEGDKYAILSDILGEEDHMGDMDFKVAGTDKGITSFQMDIKISDVSTTLMKEALAQAKEGRMHILKVMEEVIAKPRKQVSDLAPQVRTLKVDVDKIGAVIGPGGKTIKSFSEKSDAKISIDEDGTVTIFSRRKEGADIAESLIMGMIAEPEVGMVYPGTVKRVVDFGAFIEFLPGKEGLCHISKMAKRRIESVSEVLEENQQVTVKVAEIDRMGRVNLSLVDSDEKESRKSKSFSGAGRRSK